jgi:hypothetical protein
VVTRGTFAYLGTQEGLVIVDITDRSNPTIVSFLSLPSAWKRSLLLAEGLVYLTSEGNGIQIVDVKDARNPRLINVHKTPGDALGIAVGSSEVFVADRSGIAVLPLVAHNEVGNAPTTTTG